ncbi:MAG: Crp/Fnr family transcriptional regulator [Dehalococcoidia bacterium]
MTASHSGQRREVNARDGSNRLWSRPINVAEVLSGLSKSEADAIMKMSQDQRYARGTYVYELGEHQQGLYLVKAGLIEEFRLGESGNKLPMSLIVPGQLFGLSSVEKHYCCFAEAVEESIVGFLSFEKLEGICRNFPMVAYNLVQLLLGRLGEIEERLELLVFSELRARVAWTLLGLSAVHGLTLAGITHETLAMWAAGSRPKVSQILQELKQAGVLHLARSQIQIRDPIRLAELAKEVAASF